MSDENKLIPSFVSSNTSAQIQKIFAEIQLQLPSVDFDTDESTNENEQIEQIQSMENENTDDLLESLSNQRLDSFMKTHQKLESSQQPPTVELQMRLSPNPLDSAFTSEETSNKTSILSMDLFNSIDFEKLSTSNLGSNPTTSNRARPNQTTNQNKSTRDDGKTSSSDDRQILERLAQLANQFINTEIERPIVEARNFESFHSALNQDLLEQNRRYGKTMGLPGGDRKTIFIDLRHSQVSKDDRIKLVEQETVNQMKLFEQDQSSTESESDDDDQNDGMLWFEKRQLARRQLALKNGSEK